MKIFTKKETKGVHPPDNKITSNKEIEKIPNPDKVILPMNQHIGSEAIPIVESGNEVKAGQKIAKSNGPISAPIHATISGKVKEIKKFICPNSSEVTDAIVIESNGKNKWKKIGNPKAPENLTKEQMLKRIKEAGIVGLGGATFPTSVKLQPPEEQEIKAIIVNGSECEPYITADHKVMVEYTEELLNGLKAMMNILECDRAYIAIEDNKPAAIRKLKNLISKLNLSKKVTIESFKPKYPLGSEKVLLKSILGLEVPMGGLPLDHGIVVQNVSTIKSIYDAIYNRKPLIERIITVSGEVKSPKNIKARIGTPAKELVEFCGGKTGKAEKLIFGGPMMGTTQNTFNSPIQKGTNSVLLKNDKHNSEKDCIRCGSCVEACPMNLVPTKFVSYVKNEEYEKLENYYLENCMECGSCAYSCPANIPIVQYIRTGKSKLSKK